ncbi:hydantoinase B/oxoprolinase family protein [Rhodoligotrophos defluvii]|uniref:hydantoinase B/oxoprolinase family protein n=1 Tax=Rhodoligotrophos defluvii TaxID=2561934 RepID=UPI0010C9353F|nr:hydantoinase B/oxoprolinase family protein [Rhodoligotrophos defluvii]
MANSIDPITRSVIQHRLSSIVEEMGEAMLRTSYSQILNASRDFSMAICDAQCRLIAQADHIPVHVGALPWAARAIEEKFAGRIQPGDVIIVNDPYAGGGNHLPDVTVFVPVYAGDKRLFWTIARAHMGDIGGATHGAYNPAATEIWQEGIRIPPLKLYEAGKLRDDVMDTIILNVRFPRDFRGDLDAMIGAAHLGERRLKKLFDEVGAEVTVDAVEAILDGAERRARAIVESWKDGVYYGEAFLDDDGRGRENIRIAAKVTKTGSDLEIDLTDSDPQSNSFANSSHANTQAAVAMAFAYLIDPDIPKNDGVFRILKVKAKPGTVVWAENNAPVTLSTTHPSNEIVEAIVKALAPACPDRAMGGWGRRFRISITGDNPRNGKRFIWHMFHARPGGGASPKGDGWSTAGEWHSAGGIKFGSIEGAEARFPLLFESHEFRPGSGGDGQYRGGLGASMRLRVEVPAYAHTAGEGIRHGAAGMLGGKDGLPHHYRLISNGSVRDLKTKEYGIEINAGDLLDINSGGGGGWGDPARRSPDARKRDREREMV